MTINPAKITPWVVLVMITAIGASYFLFLYATWHDFQVSNQKRDAMINEALDRIPKVKSVD